MSESRLSDMSIEDDIARVTVYKNVLTYLSDVTNEDYFITYEIKIDETERPDLIAQRVYGSVELRWVVLLVTGNDDEFASISAGYEIDLPPLSVVQSYLREVRDSAS